MATKPASNGAVPDADGLRQIVGIGSVTAARLAAAGITTVDQLAALAPDELAAHGFHAHEDWIAQAQALVQLREDRARSRQPATPPPQRYALFKVKLLFAPDGSVQRTMATYMATESNGEVDRQWSGWDDTRIAEFIAEFAGLRPPAAPSAAAPEASPEQAVELVQGSIEPRPPGGEGRYKVLPAGQPFEVYLDLDLGAAVARMGQPLQWNATVLGRALGTEQREVLGVAQGQTGDGETIALSVPARPLPRGSYKLYACVSLERQVGPPLDEPIEGQLRSCLVEIF